MAHIVLDANAVGEVIAYVAPGFLAYLGHRARYPSIMPGGRGVHHLGGHQPPAGGRGASRAARSGRRRLAMCCCCSGWPASWATASRRRGTRRGKQLLARFGYRLEPDGSIYAQMLKHMSEEATVRIELKDGRHL